MEILLFTIEDFLLWNVVNGIKQSYYLIEKELKMVSFAEEMKPNFLNVEEENVNDREDPQSAIIRWDFNVFILKK